MPIDYKNYPRNWKTKIRPDILERSQNKCEFCGVANHSFIFRHEKYPKRYAQQTSNPYHYITNGNKIIDVHDLDDLGFGEKLVKVILTIAHLDHNVNNNDYDNLRALCQRCHNVYDKKHRSANAAKTRKEKALKEFIKKNKEAGQLFLWE